MNKISKKIEGLLLCYFPTLRVWWTQIKFFKWAGELLCGLPVDEKRDQATAEHLFYLNHIAKKSFPRQIYLMKNSAIKRFYEKGYCVAVEEHKQEIPCWHTVEFNEGEDDYCRKCGNSGVYRTIELLYFSFIIGGQPYSWHQPAAMMGWKPEIGGIRRDYHERGWRSDIVLSSERINLSLAVLWLWLKREGVKEEELPERMGFWEAIGKDVRGIMERLKSLVRSWKRWPEDDPDWIPF